MDALKISALLFALALLVATPHTHADIGTLSIDGEVIPANFYHGIFRGKEWCPPTSDARIRDEIIDAALFVFAGRKRGFQIEEPHNKKLLAEKTAELDNATTQGNEARIASLSWEIFSLEMRDYRPRLYNSVSDMFTRQDVLDEYKKLIDDKDPRLVDVVLVKHAILVFPERDAAEQAVELLNEGKSLNDLSDHIEDYTLHDHNIGEWFVASEVKEFSGSVSEITPGMAVVEDSGNTWAHDDQGFALYFKDVRKSSRLRPFITYGNRLDYGFNLVRYSLWGEVHDARRLERWAQADIREDGKPIDRHGTYPECP